MSDKVIVLIDLGSFAQLFINSKFSSIPWMFMLTSKVRLCWTIFLICVWNSAYMFVMCVCVSVLPPSLAFVPRLTADRGENNPIFGHHFGGPHYRMLYVCKDWEDVILPVVLYGCETWSLTLRGDGKLYPHNVNFRNIFLRN